MKSLLLKLSRKISEFEYDKNFIIFKVYLKPAQNLIPMKLLQIQFNGQQEIINALTHWPMALLGAAVAIGFLTMTVIELIKVKQRRYFHEKKIHSWLLCYEKEYDRIRNNRMYVEMTNEDLSIERDRRPSEPISDLILLSTGGNSETFYCLSIENLCGQISVAVQTALESQYSYDKLLTLLLGKSSFKPEIEKDFNLITQNKEYDIKTDEKMSNYIEAKNRIATHIQRNIDSLQIDLTFEWKKKMRYYAFLFSFLITSIGCIFFCNSVPIIAGIVFVLFIAYTGAFFAALIRDILSLIERNKK